MYSLLDTAAKLDRYLDARMVYCSKEGKERKRLSFHLVTFSPFAFTSRYVSTYHCILVKNKYNIPSGNKTWWVLAHIMYVVLLYV